jgi:hypothetical protein
MMTRAATITTMATMKDHGTATVSTEEGEAHQSRDGTRCVAFAPR